MKARANTLGAVGVELRAFSTGWITLERAELIEGGRGRVRIPVISYLIEHPEGCIIFDSGIHPELRDDPQDRLDALADLYDLELPTGTAIDERLEELDAPDIDMVICSHLHFDHCGGNMLLGDVPVVLQRDEWTAAHGGDPHAGYHAVDYDTGQEIVLIDGTHDVFDDGTVVCIPTPGHTAGHQSLQVVTDVGTFVLTADACDLREMLETSRVGMLANDKERQRSGLEIFRRLESRGAHLRFGNDAGQIPDDDIQHLTRPRPHGGPCIG